MYCYNIFVSYSHRDHEFALKVARELEALKPFVDVWIDFDDIKPADRWHDRILDALEVCHLLILIISPQAMVSEVVSDEYSTFLKVDKPILPLYYREAVLPKAVEAIQ